MSIAKVKPGNRQSSVSLLRWFDGNRRDLPWRRTEDPYAIWVSEIMLQQTRVETVLPYFERFMTRYPTVETLAEAEEEEVLGAWSGLGYYRRARMLHRAARQIAAQGGELPRDVAGLQKLPGIGTYTAAAIGSIAFGVAVPAIDGNVERVISRWLAIPGDPKLGQARHDIEKGAAELLDRERPGDSNQALMELGASVCRPRKPLCSTCPLRMGCLARSRGEPEAFPAMRVRVAPTRVRRQVAVVWNDGRLLLFRRPRTGEVLAGMWELPWVEHEEAVEVAARLEERYGGRWFVGESLGSVRHSITHRSFEVEIFDGRLEGVDEVGDGKGEAGWFTAEDVGGLPVSSLVRKVLTRAAAGSTPTLAGGE